MNVESVMKNWLETTHRNLIENLQKLLHLITSVRGLHLSKEESLKIGEYTVYKILRFTNIKNF